MERKVLFAIIAAVVIVAAVASVAVLLLSAPPTIGPEHVYVVEGDSDWFDLPAGDTTDVFAIVTDKGAPLLGVSVNVSVSPDSEGTLSATSAVTDNLGIARVQYAAFNRAENRTITLTFTANLGGDPVSGSVRIRQLAIGKSPTTAQVKGVVYRAPDRLPVDNATVQVNLLNTTGLPPNAPSFNASNSDAQGRYLVTDLPPRTAFVQVFKAGFQSQRQDITLVAGRNTRVEFVLEPLVGKVLIVWYTYAGKEEDEFLKMVGRYRQTRTDLNVVVEFQPFAGAPEKFIVAATAGNAPDVMRFQNDRLGEVAKRGFLEPLDARLDPATIQRFTPASLAAMRIEGKIYGLPATQDLLAIVYNKALFTAGGEPFPADGWTTDDLVRIAKNLTKPGQGQWGFATPQTNAFYWFPWLAGYGGDLAPTVAGVNSIFAVPDTEPVDEDADLGLDTQAAAESVVFMQGLEKVHRVMFPNPSEDAMLNQFLSDKVAMITTGPWNVPPMQRAEIDFGIAPYPVVSSTGEPARPTLGVKGFSIWKLSAVKDDAFDFIKFITSPDEQKKFSLGVGGVPGTNDIPTAQALLTDPDIQANPVIARFLFQASRSSEFPSRPEMANVWGPMTDALTFIYQDVNPASPTAVSEAQAILDREEQEIYA